MRSYITAIVEACGNSPVAVNKLVSMPMISENHFHPPCMYNLDVKRMSRLFAWSLRKISLESVTQTVVQV